MDFSLHRTSFSWVWCIEDILHLLQSLASSLHKEEVNNHQFNTDPRNVNQVQLPSDLRNANGDTISVNDHGNVEEEEVESGTLGSGTILETLNGVEGLERCESPGEDDAEEKNGDDNSVGEVGMLLGFSSEGCEHDVGDKTAAETGQHHDTTTEFIEKGTPVHGTGHGEDWVDGVDEELSVLVCYTSIFNHSRL